MHRSVLFNKPDTSAAMDTFITKKPNIIIIIIDRFYIALFSAVEQTHCARMWFYMSE